MNLGYGARGLGALLATQSVVLVFMLLAGGVIADLLTPRRVMLASDALRCASQTLLALSLTGHPSLPYLALLQGVTSVGTGVFNPAIAGLVPRVVSTEDLQPANAVLSLIQSSSVFVGPALGGLLMASVGPAWSIEFNAATFGVSGVFIALLPVQARPARRRSPWRELTKGWSVVRKRQWLWSGILLFSFQNLLIVGPLEVLGPVLARSSLGGAASWGLVVSALGLGAVIGAATMIRMRPARPLLVAICLMFGVVPELVAFAAGYRLPVVAAAALLGGACLAGSAVLWDVAMQAAVPADVLSRVSAVDYFGTLLLQPAGFALAAPLASRVGAGRELLLASAAFTIMTALALSGNQIRNLRIPLEVAPRDGATTEESSVKVI